MPVAGLFGHADPDRALPVSAAHSLIDQSLHRSSAPRPRMATASGRLVRRGGRGRCLPQRQARVERPEPARARPPCALAARVRPHPRLQRCPVQQTIAIRSATADACGCTTARSHDFHRSSANSCWRSIQSSYPFARGLDRSETLFFLALSFGLEDDPPVAVARTIGLVEDVGRRNGIEHPFQGTIATTDGVKLWAFRYRAKGRHARSTSARTSRCCGSTTRQSASDQRRSRVAPRRFGAARRPPRRLERGARSDLRRDPARYGRNASVHTARPGGFSGSRDEEDACAGASFDLGADVEPNMRPRKLWWCSPSTISSAPLSRAASTIVDAAEPAAHTYSASSPAASIIVARR